MRWIQNADIFPFLRVKHPNEDPENLSQHGTIGISQMFGKAADTALILVRCHKMSNLNHFFHSVKHSKYSVCIKTN